jgi:hypothetical protein
MALAATNNLVVFPRADLRSFLGAAMKRHRLPEALAQALVREAASFPGLGSDAALASALAQRMVSAPIDYEKARGILLVGLLSSAVLSAWLGELRTGFSALPGL